MATVPFTVKHEQYEKLVDDIQFIGYNTILRMNVSLGKKMDDGRRMSYYNEYMYNTDKYIDIDKSITLRRSFNYYLSIEQIRKIDNHEKAFIMIKEHDLFFIKKEFREVFNWFFSNDEKYKNIFVKDKNNKLILFKTPEPLIIPILTLNKFLMLEPIVISYENGNRYEGVRMYLGNDYQYVDIRREYFIGLYEVLTNINMFQSSQIMLSSVTPELGSNLKAFDNGTSMISEDEPAPKIPDKRKVPGIKNKSKSYFDKIDDM